MPIRIVRLGTPRVPNEGLRLGTVRRPPRGVKKAAFARRDFFDVWLPELSPSANLVAFATTKPFTTARWKTFTTRYRREMKSPAADRLLTLLAELSQATNFSVGCYCEDETRCHRSVLRILLQEAGAELA